ncbi:hypothetical protein TURU_123222 [Turdus rufiventris]|nr:hypothetical protein TURU_123222 [Turdus rufiventris]
MEQILLETMLRHMKNKVVNADSHHGFTKGKTSLKNLVVLYDEVTVVVDEGRATDIIYLDLCIVFDTLPHHILGSKLKRHGFDGWTTLDKELTGWSHSKCGQQLNVQVETSDKWCPQGSVLGSALFNICVSDMVNGIECTLSMFANDTELCGGVDTLERMDGIQRDLDRLERWVCVNLMKFNKSKSHCPWESHEV